MVGFIPEQYRWIVFGMIKVVLFFLIIGLMYLIVDYFNKYRTFQRALRDAVNQMDLNDKSRSAAARREREINGEVQVKGLIAKTDQDLLYSGLRNKFKWLNSEMYLALLGIFSALLFLIVSGITRNIVAGLVVCGIALIVNKAILAFLSHLQYTKVERELLQFLNIIENFAMSSDDLISILERTMPYLEDPLKSAIDRAVTEARNSGDSMTALKNLQDSVQHRFFKSFIRNLEVCSRYDANYKDIIVDSRHVLENELLFEKERQAIYTNGRVEIIAMMAMAVAGIWMTGSFLNTDVNIIQFMLTNGILGQLIVGLFGIVIILCIYFAFIANIKHK